MSTLQAFFLGGMVSWTPSLVFLACALWRAPPVGEVRSSGSMLAFRRLRRTSK
jgi:hypothetical protein